MNTIYLIASGDLRESANRVCESEQLKMEQSLIATVVCVPMTGNLRWADAPGNVLLSARLTGLPKDSVANVSQIVSLDKGFLTEFVGRIPRAKMELILSGIDVVLGR